VKNAKSELNQALARITGKGKDLLLDRDRRDQIHVIAQAAKIIGLFDVATQCAHILAIDDRNRQRLTIQRLEIAYKNADRLTDIDTTVDGWEKTQ